MFTPLQQREIFHLIFLRHLTRRLKPNTYALKGGSNLRFFFKSIRYSEDMDLDIKDIEVFKLKDIVMDILNSKILTTNLQPYQIDEIIPPNLKSAKQTETVQRFKVHLITAAREDLFTKVEFSKRKLENKFKVESVDSNILQQYKQPPLLISHYLPELGVLQKISALAQRSVTQARDVFDIFTLYPQVINQFSDMKKGIKKGVLREASSALFSIDYENYKNAVVSYLSEEDQDYYKNKEVWEEMQNKVAELMKKLQE